jgi:DNA-binding MarR family transcriptional regulator
MITPGAVKPASESPVAAPVATIVRDDGEPSPRAQQLRELGVAFRRTFRSISRLRGRDTHLGGEELSHAQFELLIELWDRGELSAGELAAAARMAPATVTQMLDHLAESGHVERTRSQTDRRVVATRLTPKGAKKIEAKHAAWESRWEQAMAGIDADELRGATRVLQRLAAMFEDTPVAAACEHDTAVQPGADAGRKPV